MRLRGTSVSELEEAGEDTTGVVASKSKLRSKIKTLSGVDILTDTGAYKSTYQVLLEISKVWKDMSDVDQAALLELIAGKNRANTAMAILSNTKDLEDAYVQSLEAEGSAYAENEKYLDSIQGKIDQFTNAVQTMWKNWIDSDVVKGFVEFATILVKVIDKLGIIPTLLIAISTISMIKNKKGPLQFFKDIKETVKEVSHNIKKWADEFNGVTKTTTAETNKNTAANVANAASNKASAEAENADTKAKTANTIATKVDTKETNKNTASNMTNAASNIGNNLLNSGSSSTALIPAFSQAIVPYGTKALTTVGQNASSGIGGFISQIPKLGKIAIGAGIIIGVVAAIDYFTVSIKEAQKATEEAMSDYKLAQNTLKEQSRTIKEVKDEYKELAKGVDATGKNISLTTEEYERYNDITNQIADMFPSMIAGYTEEGNAILKCKDNVDLLTEAYEKSAKAARQELLKNSNEIVKNSLYTSGQNFFGSDGFWGSLGKGLGQTLSLGVWIPEAATEDILKLKDYKRSDWTNPNETSRVLRTLRDAGADISWFEMWQGDPRALDRVMSENKNIVKVVIDSAESEISEAASNSRSLIDAYLGEQDDYQSLDQDTKNLISQVVQNVDDEFITSFKNNKELYNWINTNLLEDIGNLPDDKKAQIALGLSLSTQFNDNKISLEDYQDKINGILSLIDALVKEGLIDEDISTSLKAIVSIEPEYVISDKEEDGSKINIIEKLLGGEEEKYDQQIKTLTKEEIDLVDQYAKSWGIDRGVVYSWEELKQKIAEAKEVADTTKITDTLTSITSLEDAFNSLGDAVKEFKEDGTASANTLKSLSESFGEIEGFEELYKVLATGEGNVEEAITNVANAYIAKRDLLSDLSEEELQIMVARLESLGVINAQEILLNRQTLQQELDDKLQGYNIDLSAYSTVEQAKEAIANAATMNICSAVADMETELQQQYGINLSDFVSTEEAKVTAAKKAAKEIAKANKEAALSDLSKNTELTDRQYLEQQAKIESDYRNTLNSIDSIDSNLRKVVDSVSSALDSYYNQSFKFDFSGNKVGIGRDYKDTISNKDAESALEKIKKEYENKISLLEAQQTYLENEISRLEASDQQVSRDLYDEQIKLEQKKLKLYEEERKKLLAQMSTVAKNSDEWYDYAQSIWEVEHAIQETTISIVELQKKIAQLYIDVFNKIEEAYGREQSLHDKRIQYLEDEIELLKLRNEYATISPETYNRLSAEEDAKIQSNQNEIARLRALLQKGIDENGEALTEEDIADMLDTIYENEADIRQSEINKAKYEQEKKQAYLDRFNNTAEAYDNLANVYQGYYDNAEQYKKYADLYGISVPKEILDYQANQLEQQVQVTLNKKAELERQLAEAISSGDIAVGDSQWLEMVNAINECTSAANDFKYQIAELEQEIKALSVDKFNDIKDAFNNVNDVFNDRQAYIEEYMNYLEALGIDVPTEMYEELIANEKDRQASNRASLESLRRQLSEMEANGYTAEDDEWVQAQADIRALEKEILASETAMAQWNKTIQEMSFEKFDEFLKRISDICDELENVYGLISDEDVALEDGSWTEEGIMSLGLMTQKMAIAKQQAEEYAKEIDKLNEEYKKGTMSEQDYYDRLMELKNGQWESINAYKEAKDAIVDINEARIDMIEEGIQKEISAYEELIDLKKKELESERD